jgi:Berberine and berberine like
VSWITQSFAMWEKGADRDKDIEWARSFRRDIASFARGGAWLNFIGHEGEDRVRAAFGDEKYRRLAAIKGEWDPNVCSG